ncbi:protein FAR1-RELATED SEQUENCE 5-like [Rosa rugosa]|uniref:protein FAR1-RELATED SEQUENCE 5-like n=1 Tax=Rosa rugosa TaxID=74645 RepID=UPI002B404730|nr:protein FAR1-RELATED SEQUENCE 5-like [Rosa rugosa]
MDNALGATDVNVENFDFDLELDWKPRKGMEFDSEQATYDFYNRYGGKEGFSIRRESHAKNKKTGRTISSLLPIFDEEHNHPLVVKECSHMLPSQRKVQDCQGIDIDLTHDSGIGVTSLYELMGKQAGGRDVVGYTKQDVKNYLRSKRQRSLEYGEAGYIMKD